MKNLNNKKMKKVEIKNEIAEVFNSVNVTSLSETELTWYGYINNLVNNMNKSDVTKENLIDLLENIKEIFKK